MSTCAILSQRPSCRQTNFSGRLSDILIRYTNLSQVGFLRAVTNKFLPVGSPTILALLFILRLSALGNKMNKES